MKYKHDYYSEIITIQLTSYVNLKPVNWNFVNNCMVNCVQLTGFGSQPYFQRATFINFEQRIHGLVLAIWQYIAIYIAIGNQYSYILE